MTDSSIIRVRKELCLGCGLCVDTCPRQAISLQSGRVSIDQTKCNHCGLCFKVCPRAAITEFTPVSKSELGLMLVSLRQRADTIIEKIERCSMQQPTQGEKTKIRFGE